MALQWLSKVKEFLPRSRGEEEERGDGELAPVQGPAASQETASTTTTWSGFLIDQLPLAMFSVGALISACAQYVGVWAFLGFLLLALSPLALTLKRMEASLAQLVKQQRDRR